MAKRGYCGYLISFIGDVTNKREEAYLVNTANKWTLASVEAVIHDSERILNEAEEKDVFVLWYNVPLTLSQEANA